MRAFIFVHRTCVYITRVFLSKPSQTHLSPRDSAFFETSTISCIVGSSLPRPCRRLRPRPNATQKKKTSNERMAINRLIPQCCPWRHRRAEIPPHSVSQNTLVDVGSVTIKQDGTLALRLLTERLLLRSIPERWPGRKQASQCEYVRYAWSCARNGSKAAVTIERIAAFAFVTINCLSLALLSAIAACFSLSNFINESNASFTS